MQKPVSWILASLFFPFASQAADKMLPELFLIWYLVELGRRHCFQMGLLLSASTLLPLEEQLILIAHSLNPRHRSKALRGFSCVTQRARLGLLAACSPCSSEIFIFAAHTRRHWQFVIGKQELWEFQEGGFIFLKLFLQVSPSPLVNGVCIFPLLGVLWVGIHGCAHLGCLQRFSIPCWELLLLTTNPRGWKQRACTSSGRIPQHLAGWGICSVCLMSQAVYYGPS